MKKLVKLVSLILCVSLMIPNVVFAAKPQEDLAAAGKQSDMVDVLLESDEECYIVVSIPADEAKEYKKKLKEDREFHKKEIQMARESVNPNTRALPPGHIEYQSYMYKSTIQKAVDAYSGAGTFLKWANRVGKYVSVKSLSELLKSGGWTDVFKAAAKLLCTTLLDTQQRQQTWWTQAYIDILEGKIRAVRYTIVQNTADYPKVWRVFEYIY